MLFPSSRVVGDPEGFEEERRVFYVAITRAKDQLYIISPSIVQTYKGPITARLSPFVLELKHDVYQKSSVKFKSKKREIPEDKTRETSHIIKNIFLSLVYNLFFYAHFTILLSII